MASLNIASSNHTSNVHANSTNFSFTFNTPVKLDHTNNLIWRSQVLASICGSRLEKFIDETVTPPPSHISQRIDDELRSVENPNLSSWKAQDQLLLGWLLSMSEGIISLVFNMETSLEVWKAIETQFGSQSKSRLLHFRGFQSDNQRGSGSGNWNNSGGGNNNSIRPQMNHKPQWKSSKPTCQICFKTGHTANVCWKLKEFFTSGAYIPPPNRNPEAAYLADMNGAADANWYLDSGATHHLTNDMRNMTMTEPFAGNSKLIIGNGTGLHITHARNIVLRMHNSSAYNTLKLNNMLLVPEISKNLISISQLTKDNNIVIEFTDKSCFVKDNVRNLIILQGKA
ncbi:hypothetical protein AB3S75_010036 [Citrus x aurantiifolia]